MAFYNRSTTADKTFLPSLHSRPNRRSLAEVNRSALLHIVERLEGLLGKLPAAIQKPVLHELTPLKDFFAARPRARPRGGALRLLQIKPSRR